MSAGRFRWSVFVNFEWPNPLTPVKESNRRVSGSHGTDAVAPSSEAAWSRPPRALSISPRRSRIAAISAPEMRAPARFASLRSLSPNDVGPEVSGKS